MATVNWVIFLCLGQPICVYWCFASLQMRFSIHSPKGLAVVVDMFLGKHLAYVAWLSYYLVFCGAAAFYFDVRTGKVIKSHILCIYGRLFSLIFLCTIFLVTIVFAPNVPSLPTQSQLMNALVMFYPIIRFQTLFSCICCAQYWQERIYNMIQVLLKLDQRIAVSSYSVTPSEKSYLQVLYCLRVLLLV